jgi:hypothetical protein
MMVVTYLRRVTGMVSFPHFLPVGVCLKKSSLKIICYG